MEDQLPLNNVTSIINEAPRQFIHIKHYGPKSQIGTCPYCHSLISSRIKSAANTKTYFASFLMCALCCFLCSCIPCCMDSCQNINHYCPQCDAYLGTYSN